ncbi:MAG TPA: hypothetical protein VFW90_03610 [Candidatus Saccharimonadales bacterium]|nr:hypothetical protein [Candidatus Saccharimonadales bacterium]
MTFAGAEGSTDAVTVTDAPAGTVTGTTGVVLTVGAGLSPRAIPLSAAARISGRTAEKQIFLKPNRVFPLLAYRNDEPFLGPFVANDARLRDCREAICLKRMVNLFV